MRTRKGSRRSRASAAVAPALVLASVLGLAACASRGPAPQDHIYPLAPAIQVVPGSRVPVAATLLVTQPSARGLTTGRELVFLRDDRHGEVQRYNFHLWAEPPAAAIASALTAALRDARLFAFVVAPGQRAQADYLLTGELLRLEHLPSARPPQVAAALHLTLVDGYDRKPLFARLYQGTEATGAEDGPPAAAEAFDRLLGRMIGEAVRDLQALRPRLRAAGARNP
jgi:cholesterol transport system auxiliary component